MTKYSQNLRGQSSVRKNWLQSIWQNKFYALSFIILIISSIFYVIEVNAITVKGFQIKDLEKEIVKIQEENEKLQLRIVELKSTSNLEEKVSQLNLVPIDKISYLAASTYVAIR